MYWSRVFRQNRGDRVWLSQSQADIQVGDRTGGNGSQRLDDHTAYRAINVVVQHCLRAGTLSRGIAREVVSPQNLPDLILAGHIKRSKLIAAQPPLSEQQAIWKGPLGSLPV